MSIDFKRISLEVIWREVILIYNRRAADSRPQIIPNKFSQLIFKGQPFEIMDGDNFSFNYEFLHQVFSSQKFWAHKIENVTLAEDSIQTKLTKIREALLIDLENYAKRIAVSDTIRTRLKGSSLWPK